MFKKLDREDLMNIIYPIEFLLIKDHISCVYKMYFKDGTFYIGSSVNLKRRLSLHKTMLKQKSTLSFYGRLKTRIIERVEIIQMVKNRTRLRQRENREIKAFLPDTRLLNLPKQKWSGANLMAEQLKNRSKARPSIVNVDQ